MSVETYDELIYDAELEIENCNNLINLINTINDEMTNYIAQLENVSKTLQMGLVIDGVAQGKTISDKTAQINNFKKNILSSIQMINARISLLNNNIQVWKKQRTDLIVQLSSFEKY